MESSFFGGGHGGGSDDGSSIEAGHDVNGSSAASAAVNQTATAFTQEIVMGANLSQNAFDATVINGSYDSRISGDDTEA